MKTFLFASIFMLGTSIAASAQTLKSADLQVTGLTCSMCSQSTEKSLETISSINTITPDLNKGIFVLEFKKDAPVDFDQILKKVDEAGFSVGSLNVTMQFDQVAVDGNGQAIVGNNVYRFQNLKNTTLNGPIKVSVIDRDFISKSTYKKNLAKISSDAYADGLGLVNGKKTRVYHLTAS